MRQRLKAHKDHNGPQTHMDTSDIMLIEEYGQRSSKSGWIKVLITLRTGLQREVKMSPNDLDDLVLEWLDATEKAP